MKSAESAGLLRQVRRVGVGIMALTLAATFSMPTAVAAKEKASSKVTTSKQVSKKAGKKVAKAVKKTRQDKKTLKKTKLKKDKQATRSSKHTSRASKAVRKHLRKRSAAVPTQQVWNPTDEPKQAYYLIPDSVGGDAQPAQPQEQEKDTAAVGKTLQVGKASYYAGEFHGKKTASGERYDQNDLTCAHGSLPFGCKIRVTNLNNQKSVDVKVNDRGGFHKYGRVVDLSKAAAKEIGMMGSGTAKVKIEVLE
jgi:rare lipoprotein A